MSTRGIGTDSHALIISDTTAEEPMISSAELGTPAAETAWMETRNSDGGCSQIHTRQ